MGFSELNIIRIGSEVNRSLSSSKAF